MFAELEGSRVQYIAMQQGPRQTPRPCFGTTLGLASLQTSQIEVLSVHGRESSQGRFGLGGYLSLSPRP